MSDTGPGSPCAADGCDDVVEPGAHPFTRYCPAHRAERARSTSTAGAPRRPARRPPADRPPRDPEAEAGPKERKPSKAAQKWANDLYTLAVVINAFTGDAVCANALAKGAVPLAVALDRLAAENPRIRKFLNQAGASSAWFQLAGAMATITIPMLAHHGVLPAMMLPGDLLAHDDAERRHTVAGAGPSADGSTDVDAPPAAGGE